MPLWKNITCWTAKEREPRRQAHDGEKEKRKRERKDGFVRGRTSVERDSRNGRRGGRTKRDDEDKRVK